MYTSEELKKMKSEQLTKALNEAKNNLTKFRFESRTGQSKDHHKVKLAKKLVAKILTMLTAAGRIKNTAEGRTKN